MKKVIFSILTVILIMTSSCQREIDLSKYISQDTPFIRRVYITNKEGFTEINIDTVELDFVTVSRINEFTLNNKSGWVSTPASFYADYSLQQRDFRLLGWNEHHTIVVGFIDEKGKPRQLTKEIKKGELDFLLN